VVVFLVKLILDFSNFHLLIIIFFYYNFLGSFLDIFSYFTYQHLSKISKIFVTFPCINYEFINP